MKTRIISALIWAPILICFVYLGGLPFAIFLAFFTIVGQKELYRALSLNEKESNYYMYAITILLFFIEYINIEYINKDRLLISTLLVSFLCIFIHFIIRFKSFTIEKVALYMFSIMYIVIPFLMIYKIRDMRYGGLIVVIPFLMAFSSDTFAYFTGKFIGKVKLAPVLSPNKTVEGSVGGVIGSAIIVYIYISIIFHYLIGYELTTKSTIFILIMGIIGAMVSQFGDLCASAIKRQKNVKDYGDLIKGHGGVIDRTDSVIFTTIFTFIIVNLM